MKLPAGKFILFSKFIVKNSKEWREIILLEKMLFEELLLVFVTILEKKVSKILLF